VFNEVADFTTSESDPSGFLLGYGHMDSEALARSLDLLEASIKRVKRQHRRLA
jgi:GntR family transcriptional regulator/MocR family aminotransferase